jgi:DNA-binding MarR family transcriptional regulator
MRKLDERGYAYSELVIEIFRLNRLLLDAGDDLAAPVGLSSARWQILGVIEHGPATVAQVARYMGLTRQSVQQTADDLVTLEFVEFLPNPHHKRAMLLSLTPKGRMALDVVEANQAEWANRLGAKHSLADLQAALAILQKMTADLAPPGQDEPDFRNRKEQHA